MNRDAVIEALYKLSDNNSPLFFILGPCAIENEKHSLMIAGHLKALSEKLNCTIVFKSSFDKANRISAKSYRSVGLDEGLRILDKIRREFDIPVITDVHEAWQIDAVASVVDIIQIPAFLCRQTDLLVAAGRSGKIINIKKGQFFQAEAMGEAAQKVHEGGSSPVWLCERGYTFGYQNLIVDYRNFPIMKSLGYPVIFDVTHAVQRPAGLGNASGGDRRFVPDLAISAIAQGIAGLFMEVHEEPDRALSDGPNTIRLANLESLMSYLIELDAWVKTRPKPVII